MNSTQPTFLISVGFVFLDGIITSIINNLLFMKTALTSKTVWFGIAQIAFAAIGFFAGWIDQGTATTLVVTGAASVGLRFKTSEPIKDVI